MIISDQLIDEAMYMALHVLIGHYTITIASSLHGKEALEHQLNSHYSLADYCLPAISLKYFPDWVYTHHQFHSEMFTGLQM